MCTLGSSRFHYGAAAAQRDNDPLAPGMPKAWRDSVLSRCLQMPPSGFRGGEMSAPAWNQRPLAAVKQAGA
jgi:hypothetical protein